MIDREKLSEIYENYINLRRGEKGRYLEEVSKEIGVPLNKLRTLIRNFYGPVRSVRRNPKNYDINDILYAIHYSNKSGLSLYHVCQTLVMNRKVRILSYNKPDDPVQAFYQAVIRFLRSRNSSNIVRLTKRVSKDVIKKGILNSDFSDVEKIILIMAVDGKIKLGDLNGEYKEVARNLMLEGYITRKKGKLVVTSRLKVEISPFIEKVSMQPKGVL